MTKAADEEIRRRVGTAWREIRRGAAAARIKDLLYGAGPDGLDQALADALSVLCQQGPLRMGELAELLRITPASTTRAVACLVDRGFAERVKAVDDQRSIMVSSTKDGIAMYQAYSEVISAALTEMLSEFDDDERDRLADFLERFATAVDHYVDTHDQPVESE